MKLEAPLIKSKIQCFRVRNCRPKDNDQSIGSRNLFHDYFEKLNNDYPNIND